MVGFPGYKYTILARFQLLIHQYPQILVGRAALNPFIPQTLLIVGATPAQMQDLA